MCERAYTAVIRDGCVLMVRHVHGGRDYWTLPGGHIEAGETAEVAARREVLEETGLDLVAMQELFRDEEGVCFLSTCSADAEARLGCDPELAPEGQWLREVAWFDLAEKADDLQVARVLKALGRSV